MERPTPTALEDEILSLIADDLGRVPAEFIAEIRGEGADLPIDSLLVVEVLVRVETHYGVTLPANEMSADVLRSVSRFAAQILTLMDAVAAVQVGA